MKKNYIPPSEVISPKLHWQLIAVLDDEGAGPGSCALAVGRWDGSIVLAMRWNGDGRNPTGNPQSRGIATWFVVPDKYRNALLKTLPADKQKFAGNFFSPVSD
jgi:hypothetical protein